MADIISKYPVEDNVVLLDTMTTLDIPAEKVLAGAIAAKLADVIILGYRTDGSEFFASSSADVTEQVFLIERFKFFLMHEYDSTDDDLPRRG